MANGLSRDPLLVECNPTWLEHEGPSVWCTVPWDEAYVNYGWIPGHFEPQNLGILPVDLQCAGGSLATRLRLITRLRDEYFLKTCEDGKVWRMDGWWCSVYSLLEKTNQLGHASLTRWALAEDSRARAQDRILEYQIGPDGHIWVRPTLGLALRLVMLGFTPAKAWRASYKKGPFWKRH